MKAEMWRMFEVEAKAAEHEHMIGPATGFCLQYSTKRQVT